MVDLQESLRLKANSFGWIGQFFQSMAHMAPAIGIISTAQFMASRAGFALPLAMVFAMVLAILLAYCLGLLTRQYYGASGYFQIHSRALGSRIGFITSWLFLIYEPFNTFTTLLGFGVLVLEPFSEAYCGYRIPWWVGVVVGNFLVTGLSLFNAKTSVRVTGLLGVVEFLVFLVLSVVLLAHGHQGFQFQYFTPQASADGYGGLLFAFIFGFLCFVGYESGLPLTEETKDTKVSTFKGLIRSVFLAGLFFVFVSYATVVGFGGEDSVHFAKSFSDAPNPYGATLALQAFGVVGPWLIFFAAVNSTLACCLASQNSASRVFFALGRAGVFPKWMGKTTNFSKVPVHAVTLNAVLTLVVTLFFSSFVVRENAFDWYGFAGVMLVLPLLVIHFVTCVSVFVAYRYREQGQFKFLHHGIIPSVAGLLTLLPIWGAIYYNRTPPMSYAPWVVLVWFFVGVGGYLWLKKKHPDNLQALEHEMKFLS